jgi:hypothetical protein
MSSIMAEQSWVAVLALGVSQVSCTPGAVRLPEGVSGELIYVDPDRGAKGGLYIEQGRAGGFAKLINPLFPALRSGPTAVSGAARQKQIPSSSCVRVGWRRF